MVLNYQERRIYHWHEEADRRIGLDRVPDTMRVEQVLSDWIDRPLKETPPIKGEHLTYRRG